MRLFWLLLLALLLALLINALLAGPADDVKADTSVELYPSALPVNAPTVLDALYQPPEICVWNQSTKHDMRLSLEEYLVGVVAAEMPASFEMEALKAQAVAARTYTIRQVTVYGCNRSKDADICTDSTHCQAWIPEETRRCNWGNNYSTNEARVRQAVTETAGQIITYGGQPIEALFHATSNGRTENVEEVFAQPLPYLRSVQSDGEETAPRFRGTKTFTLSAAAKRINKAFPDVHVSAAKLATQMEIVSLSTGGRVKEIRVGKSMLTGRDIRTLFELDSTAFELQFDDKNLTISTTGYGHGVGMSQTGAQAMALSGATYEDILTHYYTDTAIESLAAK